MEKTEQLVINFMSNNYASCSVFSINYFKVKKLKVKKKSEPILHEKLKV